MPTPQQTANTALHERIIELAWTQQALRPLPARRAARSLVGNASARPAHRDDAVAGHADTGPAEQSIASQLALIALVGTTAALTITGTLTVPEAIALIVVMVRTEPFTAVSELAPPRAPGADPKRIGSVLTAPVGWPGLARGVTAPWSRGYRVRRRRLSIHDGK